MGGAFSSEDGKNLWRDEQLNAAGDAELSADESKAFQGEDHLVDAGRSDGEVALQVLLGRRPSEDPRVRIDEGQVLALRGCEARGLGRRHEN